MSELEDFLDKRKSRADEIIDDAESLRELGVSEDEIPSFLMQSLEQKHKITPENIPDELVENSKSMDDSEPDDE